MTAGATYPHVALTLRSDVACPWATVVLLRLRAARAELQLAELPIIHIAHSLELRYRTPLLRSIVDAEIVVCAAATPEFGWSPWFGPLDQYPVSSLLAMEAVQAARSQSEAAAEQLDLALREAFFVHSRCITARHEVLAAASRCDLVDEHVLTDAIDSGSERASVIAQTAIGKYSGEVVLPDGSEHCNPGIKKDWIGPPMPKGVPRVTHDDPAVYRAIVARAAAMSPET
jgi:predicted DsbA family dithiol-disulfide isomerase